MTHTLPTTDYSLEAPAKGGVKKWLEDNASVSLGFLLAFAYDGVIWGTFDNGLKTSAQIAEDTLQQAHLFGEDAELRLFRGEKGEWKTCLITDNDVADDDQFDEFHVLWGNEIIEPKNRNGFTSVRDRAQQAMKQNLPLDLNGLDLDEDGPRLQVRHFIDHDKKTGEAYIFLSRLVKLGFGPLAEEKFK